MPRARAACRAPHLQPILYGRPRQHQAVHRLQLLCDQRDVGVRVADLVALGAGRAGARARTGAHGDWCGTRSRAHRAAALLQNASRWRTQHQAHRAARAARARRRRLMRRPRPGVGVYGQRVWGQRLWGPVGRAPRPGPRRPSARAASSRASGACSHTSSARGSSRASGHPPGRRGGACAWGCWAAEHTPWSETPQVTSSRPPTLSPRPGPPRCRPRPPLCPGRPTSSARRRSSALPGRRTPGGARPLSCSSSTRSGGYHARSSRSHWRSTVAGHTMRHGRQRPL